MEPEPLKLNGRRVVDVIGASAGLLLCSPIMALSAILVRVTSRGPATYSQTRIGRSGRPFRIHKFRTMVSGADRMGSSITVDLDRRVTAIGRFLRRSKLDELPQLWNVLRGEMSLVGPRPDVPEIVAEYTPAMRRILEVSPGMTSVASLGLRREEELLATCADPDLAYRKVVVPYKVDLAMEHVRRQSLRFDLEVLAKTVWTLSVGRLFGDGESLEMAEARARLDRFCRKTQPDENSAVSPGHEVTPKAGEAS